MLFMRDLQKSSYCEITHNTTCFRVKPNTICCGRVTVRGDIWRVGMSALKGGRNFLPRGVEGNSYEAPRGPSVADGNGSGRASEEEDRDQRRVRSACHFHQ